jgi:phage regulator Rha-like protein
MNELVVLDDEKGIPVIDSRLLAETLGMDHSSLKRLAREHEDEIGILGFENQVLTGSAGQPEKYGLLDEFQVTSLLMLVRNSDVSISAKMKLVRSFFIMRSNIQIAQNAAQALINTRFESQIKKLTDDARKVDDCLQAHIEQIVAEECRGTETAEDLRKARTVLDDTTKSLWENGASDQEHWEVTRAVLRYLVAHDAQLSAYLKKMGMKV